MLVHYDTEIVASHFLPAIFNDDYSGVDDDDESLLKKWLDKQPSNAIYAFDESNEEFFVKDAVTGLMAMCVELHIYTNE